MKCSIRFVVVVGMLALGALPARATVGGPQVFEPLGYDARERRVYWVDESYGDSDEGSILWSLDVRLGSDLKPVKLESDRGGFASRDIEARRQRLVPLVEDFVPQIARIRSVETDTMEVYSRQYPRHLVRGSFDTLDLRFEVVCVVEPAVHLAHVYRLPGRSERLIVIAFRGIPFEEGYECQRAVVALPGADLPRLGVGLPPR